VIPHHFYAAPASRKNFDAAPVPTILYRKPAFFRRKKLALAYMLFVDPHNFYAAPAPHKNFDAVPVAPAPSQLCSKPAFLRRKH
jgi:hypothetical protein